MKIRTLMRVTQNYQVSEVEIVKDVSEDSTLEQKRDLILSIQNECLASATLGLQNSLLLLQKIKQPKPEVKEDDVFCE